MDDFDAVRKERDALRQAQRAGELITVYQQRAVELARLRKEAINRLVSETGMSATEVARQLGLSKGRVTQIRQTAPPAERQFFGVGPLTVAAPLRSVEGRALPMIASEDARARDMLRDFLEKRLSFVVEPCGIPPDGVWTIKGDTVAICGPKSSNVTAIAVAGDPVLAFDEDPDGQWTIKDRATGKKYISPMDDPTSEGWSDIAYVGRLAVHDQSVLVIAGVHALGSVGAVDYLTRNLHELYKDVGTDNFSMVISSTHDGDDVLSSEALVPPCRHE